MPRLPPKAPHVIDGVLTQAVVDWITDVARTGEINIGSVNSGFAALLAAQQAAAAQQKAATDAANQAAQAAIGASGSTTTQQATFSGEGIASGVYATIVLVNLTTPGAGNYTVTTVASLDALTSTPAVDGVGVFNGDWRIIENPGASILFSGTFTATSSLQGGEGGAPFYTNDISFVPDLPNQSVVAAVASGAVTVELQLRRSSGTTSLSGVGGSLLVVFA